MPYKALTYVNLPPDNRKAPGDTITDKELKDADPQQGKEEIKALLAQGVISEDMDAPVDKAHAPVDIAPSNTPLAVNVVTGDLVEGSESSE
jgi:hypothetical protein